MGVQLQCHLRVFRSLAHVHAVGQFLMDYLSFRRPTSYANQNLRSYYYIKDIHKISRSYHDVLLILIMSKVCKRFEKGYGGYTVKGLSVETNLPSGVVGRLTHELNRMHLLVFDRTNEDAAVRFAPAEDINHLTVTCCWNG